MFIFIVILILIIAVLLSVVVLLQSGKGGGLSGIGGGQTTQILGARQAPDLLEKATWALGSLFLFLSLATTFFTGDEQVQDPSAFEQAADQAGDLPAATPLPTTPGAPGPEVPGETPSAPPSPDAAPADAAPADAAPAETE
ncbi:preprotein translocase subunit SecG [Rubricoccus marinus]|uniref:Protein-export membrane protein SecG n=1 Tax=Rubricoccus marinus TaxID=716817 RepID=A0A259TYT1_9BACT|nr:preprotein translocase subunit SecG [Rubricoccus marinus]OZC02734.1 preprotein translocase subunit SecG [Rubricoccus marinus]